MNANLTRAYILGCVAVSGLIIATAVAETSGEDDNPYAVISDKNVFHLNPPPPPPTEAVKPPDLPKVMLSGFQKVGSRMMVYLAIPAKDPKDTAYLSLQAGEKANDVEIVKIRAEKQEVDIINTGTPMTLSISNNGFALSAGAGGAGKPGGPPAAERLGGRHMPGMPGAAPPNLPGSAARMPVSNGGSAIIVGGGGSGGAENTGGAPGYGSSSYGASQSPSYGGGAIVSGGQPAMPISAPNTPAAQVANTLFSGGAQGQYRMPTPENVAPAPPEVQAAGLLLHQAAGGPPAPPVMEQPPEQ